MELLIAGQTNFNYKWSMKLMVGCNLFINLGVSQGAVQSVAPSYQFAPVAWWWNTTFASLTTVKISVSSYILIIPNPKHWKTTERNKLALLRQNIGNLVCFHSILILNLKQKAMLAVKKKNLFAWRKLTKFHSNHHTWQNQDWKERWPLYKHTIENGTEW